MCILAAVLAALIAAPAQAHAPGCRTHRCDAHAFRLWLKHHPRPSLPYSTVASWFDDAESLACSPHRGEPAVANKYLPCGTRLRVCNGSRCALVVVEDRGPYIAGRELDLNPPARDAIGCPGICNVRYGPA